MKKIIFVVPVFLTSFSLMSQTLKEIVSKTAGKLIVEGEIPEMTF